MNANLEKLVPSLYKQYDILTESGEENCAHGAVLWYMTVASAKGNPVLRA